MNIILKLWTNEINSCRLQDFIKPEKCQKVYEVQSRINTREYLCGYIIIKRVPVLTTAGPTLRKHKPELDKLERPFWEYPPQ